MATGTTEARTRSADKLVATFEAQIRSGALADGAVLPPEREIAQSHGVSRTVAREAVLALANKGLIRARKGFRPVVVTPGVDTAIDAVSAIVPHLLQQSGGVRHLFELRILIEVSLVRQAARDARRVDLENLRDALAANGAAVDDAEAFYRTDTAFHGVLFAIPGNPVLPALHRAFTDWLHPHWSAMPRDDTRNIRNHAAHTRVYDAILMRDPDQAEAELRAHLDQAWEQVHTTLRDSTA